MKLYGIKIKYLGWSKVIEEWYTVGRTMFFTEHKSVANAMLENAKNHAYDIARDNVIDVWIEQLEDQ